MKAYEIMSFLLIFNLSISVIAILSIYNLGVTVGSDYDVSQYESTASDTEKLAFRFLAINLVSFTAGIVAGALIGSWVLKIPADSGAAYGAFTGVFWGACYNAMSVIWNIGEGQVGVMVIVFVFTALTGVVFFVGLMQLVRGGWRGMK